MIKIAFIIDKGFMQSLIEKCRKQLLSDLNCSIDTIQWNHELRKSFSKADEYDFVINFSTHTLFKKDYPHENLIQIPFISNLRSGISRELYQSIINNDDSFLLNTIKTFAGKQSFQIHGHRYLLIHHSYNRSFKFIIDKIPNLLIESINRFHIENQTIWQDNHPKSIPIRKYKFELFIKKIKHYLKTAFTYHYWKTGIIENTVSEVLKNKILLKQVQWIKTKNKRDFIADPFGFTTGNGDYIIYEKYNWNKKKGHIEVSERLTQRIVFKLKADFHFSYPFVLEDSNEIYIIPETHQTNSIDLYKWNDNKQEMEMTKTIIDNFPGVDNTILKHNNKYWLFCTTSKYKMSDHQLNLFYADKLTGNWTPHPLNPIVTSITNSRPAGSFIKIGGKIIRPSQNSGLTYGGKIVFNEIIELSETKYAEKIIEVFSPEDFKNKSIKGIHTISPLGNSTLIDAKFTGFKIGKLHF
jgi:hypothetical protein